MPAAVDPPSREGRVAVVTGGSSGIGLEVARGLAAAGLVTVVVGRDRDRVDGAVASLRKDRPTADVRIGPVADLSRLAEARRGAAELRAAYPRVAVLVNNAGAYFTRRAETVEGHERTFALNVLSPLILTQGLVEPLRGGAPARVINVASAAHEGQQVPWDDLEATQGYRGFRQYGRSKLELLLWTRELARRWRGVGIAVNAVHPGFVRSGFAQNNGGGTALGIRLLGVVFGRSVVRGADTPVWLATSPEVASATGAYFADRHERSGSAASRDPAAARRFYDTACRLADVPPSPEP